MKIFLVVCLWGVASATTDSSSPNPSTEQPASSSWAPTTEDPDTTGTGVIDYRRPCPEGFFYAGEPSFHELKNEQTRGYIWAEKGPTSPVYSCYRIEKEKMDWASANRKCWERESQLLSVNNPNENLILSSDKFTRRFNNHHVHGHQNEDKLPTNVLTSGVNLGDGHWFWFATGQPLEKDQTATFTPTDSCVLLSFEKSSVSYSSVSCVDTANSTAVCEVRVYVQTWYVWFFDNWLQLLFLFTLVLLIISACLTLQVWTRSSRRRPTTPSTTSTTTNNNNNTSGFNNNKYVDKGKELLAKVVFYSPSKPDDKERLTTQA